ncbi:MAG: glycosyltransferase family 9 protein [Chlorobiota bacterium]|nr:glycosyltransferase family 9 protein [Chlorobiota bacterium]
MGCRLQHEFGQARRIGIVRTDRVGDMVLTLPMVRAIHRVNPRAEVLIFAHSRTEALLRGQPEVAAYGFVDREPLRELLRRYRPEVLFFPRPVLQEAWEAYRQRVPCRIGSGYRWYSGLFTHRIYEHRRLGQWHEAQYNVRMVEFAAGVQGLPVELVAPRLDSAAQMRVRELLEEIGAPPRFWVLHPGGGGSAPRWSPQAFGELGKRLNAAGIPCVFTGTAAESAYAEAIRAVFPEARLLFGRTTLEELIALLECAAGLVANSTGVVHLAAALGVPVVGLYARSPEHHPRRWGPCARRAIVLVPPDTAAPQELEAIPVEAVVEAVRCLHMAAEAALLDAVGVGALHVER